MTTPDIPADEPLQTKITRARRAAPVVPESAITAACLAALNTRARTRARKVHQGAFSGSGQPDIDACCEGRAVKIEVKRPEQRPSAAQMVWLQRWQQAGALVAWVTSVAELDAVLEHVHDLTTKNALTGSGYPVAPR